MTENATSVDTVTVGESTLLQGQTAIISGGAGDIALACALALARRGADIALGDILPHEQASPRLEALRATGRRVRYDVVNAGDVEAVRNWVDTVEAECGAPSLILPTAAVVALGHPCDLSPEAWQREIQINLSGAFYLAQAGAQLLRAASKTGRIVFLGSWVGHAPQTHNIAYCASKAGMRMMMKCLARALAEDGILVNEVAPGNVDAGLTAQIFADFPEERDWSLHQIPIHQHNRAEDIAFQVAHLCDPRNTQMTGTTIIADGGFSLLSYQAKPGQKQTFIKN